MNYHTIWFFLVLLIAIVLPFLGNAFVFEPITWLYWITSFPLSIFFGSALQNYTNTEASRHKILTVKRFKNLLVLVLCILVILSIAYSVTSPLASDPYSLLGAPFASSQPLGYLQSTVPTSQEANLVSVLSTALTALPSNSTIYLGEQFYGLSLVLPNPHSLQLKPVGLIDSESNLSSLASYGTGFTVWWTEANGWYGVNSIPNNFTPMITVDAFSLYRI